jgi:hypothetical protein
MVPTMNAATVPKPAKATPATIQYQDKGIKETI